MGQQFLWERSFHLEYESFYSVCQSTDNQILAGGLTTKFGFTDPVVGEIYGSALVKLGQEGDSLWIKKMPFPGKIQNLIPNGLGLIWAVYQVRQPYLQPSNDLMYFPAVTLLADDSAIVVQQSFPALNTFQLGDSYLTTDGGLLLFGTKSPSLYPGYTSDFYALKLDGIGNLEWSRAYNPGPTNSFCQGGQVEPMANGNFLVSGSMGSRIVSFEIDPETGNDTNFVQWYQTPSNHLFDSPGVLQAPDSSFIVSGSKRVSPAYFYLGRHKSPGVKNWGGEQRGGSFPPVLNADGSCIMVYGISPNTFVVKINSDSSIAWNINTLTQSQLPGRKVLNDILYNPDGTGYMVGYNTQTGQSDNFYIAKFSGIGEPFDPTGVKHPHLVKSDAVPFPNPTQTSFRFRKAFQKGEVYLFSITGKRVFSEPHLLPDCAIDVSGLAAGTYLYRAVLDGRPHWGKVVKAAP